MDSHLEVLPTVSILTTRGLAGGNAKELGGHTDGAGHLHLLVEGNALNIGAAYRIRNTSVSKTYPSPRASPWWK